MNQSPPSTHSFPTLEHAQILHRHFDLDGWDQWRPGQPLPGNLPTDDWFFLYRVITTPDKPRTQLKSQRTSTLTGIELEIRRAKQRLWNLRYRLKKQHDPAKQADLRIRINELSIHITDELEPQYKQFKKDAMQAYYDHFGLDPSHSPTALHPDETPFGGYDSLD